MGYIISSEQLYDLLGRQRACVPLNSRQSKRPCARDSWVRSTASAVEALVAQDYLFLTSLGMNTWELTAHLINRGGGRQVIVVPPDLKSIGFDAAEGIVRSFRLDPDRVRFFILNLSSDQAPEDWPHFRDSFLTNLPITIVPISIRLGGGLDKLVASTPSAVDKSFVTPYTKPAERVRYDWNAMELNPSLPPDWPYLTHWTRSSAGPFPGQDYFEFYESVLSSQEYPGSAFHSLTQMLKEGRIRASTRFIRGEYPVVSMTALHPREALSLMRWRRRYAYYSFEPYGIAIDLDIARQHGCREVSYGSAADYESLPGTDRPFFQNAESAVADWRAEAEWRHNGDLRLADLPASGIRVITLSEDQARQLREWIPYRVVALTRD